MKPTIALLAAFSLTVGGCKGNDESGKESAEGEPGAEQTPGDSDTAPAPAVPEKRTSEKKPLPADPGGEHGGAHEWSIQLGGSDRESTRAIAIDGDGNVVLGGLIAGKVDAGDTELEADEVDAAVFKLDSSGAVTWARNFGGPGDDMVEDLAIDGEGNIAIGGAFADQLVFGEHSLPSVGADDAFVARLEPSGRRLWAKRIGGPGVDNVHAVATTSSGDILVTGVFRQRIELDAETTLESAGRADAMLMAISPEGEYRWVRQLASDGDDYGRDIAVADDGSIYWLAEFSREATVGQVKVQSVGNRDFAVIKLSAAGEPQWARSFGGLMDELAVALAIDPVGDLYVAGSFDDKMELAEGLELESAGASDAFVVKLDGQTAKPLWARSFGDERDDLGSAVAVDGFGNALVTGWYWNQIDFGGGPRKSNGEKDIFAVKLSPEGEHLWSKNFGGKQADYVRDVAFTADGAALLTGTFYLTADFGGEKMTARWKKGENKGVPTGDAFVLRLGR